MAGKATLRFQALQSSVDTGFWAELRDRKLNDLRLSEEPIPVTGYIGPSGHQDVAAPLRLDESSMSSGAGLPAGLHPLPGTLRALNTTEGFRDFDRAAAMHEAGSAIWSAIASGAAEEDPALLSPFLLHCYADLKKYSFFYWFAFPVIKPPQPFCCGPSRTLSAALGDALAGAACVACDQWRAGAGAQHLWLLRLPGGSGVDGSSACTVAPLASWSSLGEEAEGAPSDGGATWALAATDPAAAAAFPGWPLRNALLLAAAKWGLRSVRVVCLRESRGRCDPGRSLLLEVELPEIPKGWEPPPAQVVGWEVNAKGKPGPRMADIGAFMDPRQLAASAVDLNLSLMRWRAAPTLDVSRISATKCLLLGAGTLGCAVARTLLGWGVRHITLADSGRVAFSNPVRQSLYVFEDCLEGGRPKAQAAAEALRAVFPECSAEGCCLSIAMPGHPPAPSEADAVREATEELENLVKAHDCVFLLTDTRESRWLPTLLAAVHGKLAINAALGYDGFLVMRHGHGPCEADVPSGESLSGQRLGCYFCNDVVAPLDSTQNRAMDQQCTVARPGLAPTAGALAVELMASVLQHPLGIAAPAPATKSEGAGAQGTALPLGQPPHMIRGYLSSFSQQCLEGRAFSQCTACSGTVVNAYREGGWSFLHQVLNKPAFLEELTGLAELQRRTAAMFASMEDEDEDVGRLNVDDDSDDDWAEL